MCGVCVCVCVCVCGWVGGCGLCVHVCVSVSLYVCLCVWFVHVGMCVCVCVCLVHRQQKQRHRQAYVLNSLFSCLLCDTIISTHKSWKHTHQFVSHGIFVWWAVKTLKDVWHQD